MSSKEKDCNKTWHLSQNIWNDTIKEIQNHIDQLSCDHQNKEVHIGAASYNILRCTECKKELKTLWSPVERYQAELSIIKDRHSKDAKEIKKLTAKIKEVERKDV